MLCTKGTDSCKNPGISLCQHGPSMTRGCRCLVPGHVPAQLGAVSAQRGSPRETGGEAGQRVLAAVWDTFHPVKIDSELDTEQS